MDGLQQAFLNLAVVVITGIVSLATKKVTAYFKQKGVLQKFEAKKESVNIAVNAVEQIYFNEDGPVRYEHAKKRAIEMLRVQGIIISDAELDTLIESAVSGLKQGYNEGK